MYFKNKYTIVTTAILASFLSGCVTPTGPVDVTRFSDEGALTALDNGQYQGSFALANTLDNNNLSLSPYKAAVVREMQRLGFSTADGETDYIVDLKVDRYDSRRPKNSNVSVGGGARTGSFGSGIGLGLGINLGGSKKRTHTELAVRISRRSDGDSVWEGRAIQAAKTGSPAAQQGIAASKLASALFQGFPGASGETIEVE